MSSPSFAQPVVSEMKENSKKMAMWNPEGKKHAKGGTTA